ncbi:hypothetical protein Pmar_PMAR009632 [Perkinsus marinus ATCC 50983]|uniref:Uncharacterized protein n=1 Tax=Perkinsus marinus (strain ATCC 50983 / TXsc) TaxID=423536 RepID=C5M015_PERM5|nr:hypothetical protein Pmar_PMAR009632 [Perkinsus marinus ATCC 50983]EEQ97673.1 hypothetical protein Pmar_PMAR009632 [Perkinsus marinus ATCC 50983]|eukprot:XP_002764956.1 hypothetical protein Pmar_PMAR009632 [Perkinsus marinus ATCC 50983]
MDQLEEPRQSWAIRSAKKVLGALLRSAPPRPCKEVEQELRHLKMGLREVHKIYAAFYQLKQDMKEVPTDSLINLVRDRKEYVAGMLRNLVELGGCFDTVKWDEFLYIFLRFCSLSKIELCQLMFLIIVKDVKSWTVHYLTASQLDEFYSRCIQRSIPSSAFWENYDRTEVFDRKLTLEFFLMRKTHIFLQGVPAFRETCDMLLPAVMGADPLQRNPHATASTERGYSPNATSVEPVAPRSPELPTAGLLTSTYATLDIESVSKARTSVTEFETNLNLLPKVPRKAAAESVKSAEKISTEFRKSFGKAKKKSSVEEDSDDDDIPFDRENIAVDRIPKWMHIFVNPPVKKSFTERALEAEFIRKSRERREEETKSVMPHRRLGKPVGKIQIMEELRRCGPQLDLRFYLPHVPYK